MITIFITHVCEVQIGRYTYSVSPEPFAYIHKLRKMLKMINICALCLHSAFYLTTLELCILLFSFSCGLYTLFFSYIYWFPPYLRYSKLCPPCRVPASIHFSNHVLALRASFNFRLAKALDQTTALFY